MCFCIFLSKVYMAQLRALNAYWKILYAWHGALHPAAVSMTIVMELLGPLSHGTLTFV